MEWPQLAVIQTDRLSLQPLCGDHAESMVEVLADSALYTFTGGTAPSLDALRKQYAAQSIGHSSDGQQWWCNWIVEPDDTRSPAGYVQATVQYDGDDLEADIAGVVQPDQQGKGIATEAARGMVDWLAPQGVTKLVAFIHPEHEASGRVAAKLGLFRTDEQFDGEDRWEGVIAVTH